MTLIAVKPATENAERNRFIYEYYRAYPDLAYKDIAEAFSISRQRVRYLVQRQFRNEAIRDRDILAVSLGPDS